MRAKHTDIVVRGTASSRKLVATVIGDRLDTMTTFHKVRAGNIWTHTLKRDTTIVNPCLYQNGILGTLEWMEGAVTCSGETV